MNVLSEDLPIAPPGRAQETRVFRAAHERLDGLLREYRMTVLAAYESELADESPSLSFRRRRRQLRDDLMQALSTVSRLSAGT